ncbi:MAG TPA: hypothetical protein VE130_10115 [Nitrososphaeraceae archaeon]|nr:hypothetical protein [Nitrososphaeraceae archaeon]
MVVVHERPAKTTEFISTNQPADPKSSSIKPVPAAAAATSPIARLVFCSLILILHL